MLLENSTGEDVVTITNAGNATFAGTTIVDNSTEGIFRVKRSSRYGEIAQNSSGTVFTGIKADGGTGFQISSYGASLICPLGIGTSDASARTLILGGRPNDTNSVTLGFDSGGTYRGSFDFTANTGKFAYWVYDSSWIEVLALNKDKSAEFGGSVYIAPSAQIRMPQTDTNRYGAIQVDQTGGTGQGTAQSLRLISKNDYGSIYEQRITMETNGSERFVVEFNGVCSGNLNDTSDVSLKKTIKPIESSLDIIKELNPVSFYWKKGENRGEDKQKGFIAQEVESIIPEVVHGEDGNKSINVTGIVAQLTKALQELSDKVEALDNT
jgi:hypothetical protein